jgi:hypothetical protein
LPYGIPRSTIPQGDLCKLYKNTVENNSSVGNSDIVADFVYRDSEQIIEIVSSIKRLDGIDKAVWSEEVYVLPISQRNLAVPFHRPIKEEVS